MWKMERGPASLLSIQPPPSSNSDHRDWSHQSLYTHSGCCSVNHSASTCLLLWILFAQVSEVSPHPIHLIWSLQEFMFLSPYLVSLFLLLCVFFQMNLYFSRVSGRSVFQYLCLIFHLNPETECTLPEFPPPPPTAAPSPWLAKCILKMKTIGGDLSHPLLKHILCGLPVASNDRSNDRKDP